MNQTRGGTRHQRSGGISRLSAIHSGEWSPIAYSMTAASASPQNANARGRRISAASASSSVLTPM